MTDQPTHETILRRKIRNNYKKLIPNGTEPSVSIIGNKKMYLTKEAMDMLPPTFGIFYHWKYFAIIEGELPKAKFVPLVDCNIEDGTFLLMKCEDIIIAKRQNWYKAKT